MQLMYLCCPACHGKLEWFNDTNITCQVCQLSFSQVAIDIVDFRYPKSNPLVDLQSKQVRELLAMYPTASFAEMINTYSKWSANAEHLVSMYTDYRLDLDRGRRFFEMFIERWRRKYGNLIESDGVALELGCGTGKGILALTSEYQHILAIDPDLPSLIMARKLLDENNLADKVTLILCYAQHLPIKSHSVALCQAQNVFDHLFQVLPAMREVNRVLKQSGTFCADSHNRYDLFSVEPHVKIRAVGWLPRSLMPKYVKWRTGETYEGIHLLSLFELKAALDASFGRENYCITFPDVTPYGYSDKWNQVLKIINRIPLLSYLLLLVFPSQLILARK